jgi:hypothetical protein
VRRINAERLRRFRLALGIALLLGGMTALWVAPQRAFERQVSQRQGSSSVA